MCKKYRVVLTCWDYCNPKPYADVLPGVNISLYQSEILAKKDIEEAVQNEIILLNELGTDNPRSKLPIYDSDGNIVNYDYPFRGELHGDVDGAVRFWDGDDYQNVTLYNIHALSCDADDIEKCSYFKYRGFYIIPNKNHSSFKVEQFDTVLFSLNSLEKALREIDNFIVDLSYGKHSLKNSINDAAIRKTTMGDKKKAVSIEPAR